MWKSLSDSRESPLMNIHEIDGRWLATIFRSNSERGVHPPASVYSCVTRPINLDWARLWRGTFPVSADVDNAESQLNFERLLSARSRLPCNRITLWMSDDWNLDISEQFIHLIGFEFGRGLNAKFSRQFFNFLAGICSFKCSYKSFAAHFWGAVVYIKVPTPQNHSPRGLRPWL
jgi:hypothetical protein